jgi:HlyD family secretion protein
MFVRTYVIPLLAVAGVGVAAWTAFSSNKPVVPAQPVAQPAASPFASPVAGAGIVEASTRNIAIGTNVPGIVTKVYVQIGDQVKAGMPLFSIDDRTLRSELAVRQSELASAEASLAEANARLGRDQRAPRVEDLPPLEARVAEAQASLEDARVQLRNAQAAQQALGGAVSKEELDRRLWAVALMEARVRTAQAELDRTKAGTWSEEVSVTRAAVVAAQARVDAAKAQVESVKIELERLTVKAPVDGEVLQVNVRLGEYAQGGVLATPLMLFGDTQTLHIRVDVDENDAWRIERGAKARGSLRGNSELATDLTFVKIEPYVVPKRSLTGDSAERVDTRVLQVVYSFSKAALPVYVGQQMDVFIEGKQHNVK